MAFYPAQLQSANLEQFGIVYADEVQGHKTVADLDALYDISDAILSKSTTNSGNDAIGQQWYVISEECYYRLDNWANRNQASGWRKMQNVDEEFDSLQSHGADKIESFTTTDSTVLLNYNTWKNSTSNVDGSVTIPAATGDQAGVLTANGKDQLTQLNKIAEVTHLTDDGVFTEEASTVTIHYSCINTREGATSSVVIKSEAIPAATLTNAGVLDAAHRNQLEQLDKLGEVTHLTDNGVFTTDANTVTLHYQCIDTDAGANSEVTERSANIPAATSSVAGIMTAADKIKLDTTIPNYTVNGYEISFNPVLNSGDIRMDDYTVAIGTSEDELTINTTDTAGIALGKLQKQLLDDEEVTSAALTKLNSSCGFDTNGNYNPTGAITGSASNITSAITNLDSAINSYTINGFNIVNNPILDGADIRLTGYSQPSSTSAISASDTINGAIGKLERSLNNEISNRTGAAINDLRDEINNNVDTRLTELEEQINENIDTRLTEVEGEINNTITPQINNINTTISNLDIFSDISTDSGTASSTTNNDSLTISGGSNVSTSGSGKTITVSLDSTISLTRVNASSGFYQQSDKRLESNIKPLEHTLEDICSIPTDSFILNGKQDLGTIAQDIEKIIPEVVCECEVKAAEIPNPENFTKVEKDGETYVLVKEVDYAKLSILALEGVKLLKAEIDKLKEELALKENK